MKDFFTYEGVDYEIDESLRSGQVIELPNGKIILMDIFNDCREVDKITKARKSNRDDLSGWEKSRHSGELRKRN